MDILPLQPKTPVLAADAKPQFMAAQLLGSEATQTVQAVQAVNRVDAKNNAPAEQHQEPTTEQLVEMAEQMDSFVGSFTHELKFRVDEDSGRNVVTVVDKKSGDTIRQIPTEELLEVIARLAEASGGLINVKA